MSGESLESRVAVDEIQNIVRLSYRYHLDHQILNQINKPNTFKGDKDYCASELAEMLTIPLGKVYKRLKTLHDDGLIDVNCRRISANTKWVLEQPKPSNAHLLNNCMDEYEFILPILADNKTYDYWPDDKEGALQNRIKSEEVLLIKQLTDTLRKTGYSINILNYMISNEPCNINELSYGLDLPLSSTYRCVSDLVKRGFVKESSEKDEESRKMYYEINPEQKTEGFEFILSSIMQLISPTIQNSKLSSKYLTA